MLNPFFLQGQSTEQNLIQDLINEQIKMYGIEVIYMPRTFVNEKTIMKEVTTSKFTKSFPIEAYVENYDGYVGNDITLSKFGIRTQDQTTLIISQDRYDTYISALLTGSAGEMKLTNRPKEGDLVYFPLSNSLMEIKYVEDRDPFFQLQKNYIYKLTCEVFEYEDEVIEGVPEVNAIVDEKGYLTTLTLAGVGTTATAVATFRDGGIYALTLTNDGAGYETTPTIRIEPPDTGETATAVAITTANQMGYKSIQRIEITNPGYGYTQIPTVTFVGGLNNGNAPTNAATAVAGVGTTGVVGVVTVTSGSSNYGVAPSVTFSAPDLGYGLTATGYAVINNLGAVSQIKVTNAGYGYTQPPTITIGMGQTVGVGTFAYGDLVKGVSSLTTAFAKDWDVTTLTLRVNNAAGSFEVGEVINTTSSDAAYTIRSINYDDEVDPFADNDTFETEADAILDFTESNPFGEI